MMQPANKAELERMINEDIITDVHEHTEWIHSIVDETRWQSKTSPQSKGPKQNNWEPVVLQNNWWHTTRVGWL